MDVQGEAYPMVLRENVQDVLALEYEMGAVRDEEVQEAGPLTRPVPGGLLIKDDETF